MTREQTLEAALADIADGMGEMSLADAGRYAGVMARKALATPPDTDTRVVTPDMIRGWLDGFKAALDTAKSITVSVGVVSQADVVGILQSSFDRQQASIDAATRVVSVDQAASVLLNNVSAFQTMVDVGEDIHSTGVSFNVVFYDALQAIIKGKDQ